MATIREDTLHGRDLVRHGLLPRVIHWAVALSFFLSLLTGLPIWTPIFGWTAVFFGGLAVCRWLHPILGIAFSISTVFMFVKWVGEMRLEKGEGAWLGPKLLTYLSFVHEDPDVGKYNGGQKMFFFLSILLGVALVVTGIVLWYPVSFSPSLRQVSWLLHDGAFVLLTCSTIFHVYLGSAAEPGTFRAMLRGTVTQPWARLHHPRWYRQVMSGGKGASARN